MTSMKYTHAVVCRIPQSFEEKANVDYKTVKKQHEMFVKTLRDTGIDVLELPADEKLPFCGYVEDTAVICNGIALITKLGLASREKEVILFA